MPEIIRYKTPLLPHIQMILVPMNFLALGPMSKHADPGQKFLLFFYIMDSVPVLLQISSAYPNVLMKNPPFPITVLLGTFPQIKGRILVAPEKCRHSVCMIIVGMGKDSKLHLF